MSAGDAPPLRMRERLSGVVSRGGAHAVLWMLWWLHLLPFSVVAALGRGLGRLLLRAAGARRRVAQRNIELCWPDWSPERRQALLREHFEWLGRSLLDRCVLWWAPRSQLKSLVQVQGDVGLADRTPGPFMWVVPHFLGLEAAALAVQLHQSRVGAAFYQQQSNPVFDAAMRRGRLRFGQAILHTRHHNALKLLRDIRGGAAFFNLPDMDFGMRDAAFVPLFGQPAATLLAPARMARSLRMTVQPVLAEILPGGQGYRVTFCPPLEHFPGEDDDLTATRRLNAWIEEQVRAHPAQYLWVHKRFKTRPPGEPDLYR